MRSIPALLVMMLLGPCGAQVPATFPVHGMVLNSVTGEPVRRALVEITGTAAVLSDDNGRFEFDDIPAGLHQLTAGKPGFAGSLSVPGSAPPADGEWPQATQFRLGADTPDQVVKLTPEAILTGSVESDAGEPVAKAQVTAFMWSAGQDVNPWRIVGAATADHEGNFRLAGLPGGRFMVEVRAYSGNRNWIYLPVDYPGPPGAADSLALGAGTTRTVRVTLKRAKLFPVSITVPGAVSGAAGAVFLQATNTDGFSPPVGFSSSRGVYRIELPDGTWTIEAHANTEHPVYGRTEITVADAPADASIALVAFDPLPVHFTAELTHAAPGGAPPGWPDISLELVPADPLPLDIGPGASIQQSQGSDGTRVFRVQAERPGRFWLNTTSYGQSYIAAATQGGQDLGQAPVTVAPGAPPLELTLRDDFSQLQVHVALSNQDESALGVMLLVIPLDATTNAPIRVFSGARPGAPSALFSMRVPPGSYRVVALDERAGVARRASEAARAWDGQGQVVNVAPGQRLDVNLGLTSTGAAGAGSGGGR